MSKFHRRLIEPIVEGLLSHMPVVGIEGPRQCGKTTLLKSMIGGRGKVGWRYVTLDNPATLAAACDDPVGFVSGDSPLAIDEIQRAPELLLAIKAKVDSDRRPGRILITGSADLLRMPRIPDSLAGRMALAQLLPLAESEVRGKSPPQMLPNLFSGRPPTQPDEPPDDMTGRALTGGFPAARVRDEGAARRAWFRSYIRALIEKDVPEVATIQRSTELLRLLQALALSAGALLNVDNRSGDLGIARVTVERYVTVLENLWVVRRVPSWHRSGLKRLIKSAKIHFVDSGLLAAIAGYGRAKCETDRTILGALVESWVFAELSKLATWNEDPIAIYHYRDRDQVEVDFVLENEGGDVVGVEVKAALSVRSEDFSGLSTLRRAAGSAFRAGIVLYNGPNVYSFGNGLWAVPFSVMWS